MANGAVRRNGVLRLDLHTHPRESTNMQPPSLDIAVSLVNAIRAGGLDGIAITEHYGADYGLEMRDLIDAEFGRQAPIIIPGREIYEGSYEVVELLLPSGRVFRYMPHPNCPEMAGRLAHPVHGIEIANGLHGHDIRRERVESVAVEFDLMLLRNSDAHRLESIGSYFNELTIDALENAAALRPVPGWPSSTH